MRRAVQAKSASGSTVAGPIAISSSVIGAPWPKLVGRQMAQPEHQREAGRQHQGHSTKRPACASTSTRLRMTP